MGGTEGEGQEGAEGGMGAGWGAIFGSLISAGAGLWGSSGASDAMEDAARQAGKDTMSMWDDVRGDMAPYRAAGQYGLSSLTGQTPVRASDLDYTHGEDNIYEGDDIDWIDNARTQFEHGDIGADTIVGYRQGEGLLDQAPDVGEPPSYDAPDKVDPYSREMYEGSREHEFLMEEGTRALSRGLGARGHQQSGAEQKALLRYGQGLASTQYGKAEDSYYRGANFGLSQDYDRANFGLGQYYDSANFKLGNFYQSLNPYMSLANLGQVQQRPPYGASAGSTIAGGQAEAGGYINSANVLSQGASSASDNWSLYNFLNPSSATPVSGSTGGTGGYPGAGTYGVSPGSENWH